MRKCPLTDSGMFLPFYSSINSRVMTSDQRIIEGQLRKIIFPDTGVVANEKSFESNEIEKIYGNDYELNTSGNEEHIFFTDKGPISRSQVYFEWIKPFIPSNFNKLIEIGCGEGRVLEKIVKAYPGKEIIGFDGSYKAAKLGRIKGLDITQKLIFENDLLPNADVFLLIGVIEHVENIYAFLNNIINSLNEGGRIIICLPIQDYGGYDIFFAEHVWHFTVKHFEYLLNKFNLNVIIDSNHHINYGFGLFVCEKGNSKKIPLPDNTCILIDNLNFWKSCFEYFDTWISLHNFNRIAVFGASEIFTLFMAYSSLSELNIVACIDDTKEDGSKKHGIPIYKSEWLKDNEVDLLLLAVNKKYHNQIINKLEKYNLNIHPIY